MSRKYSKTRHILSRWTIIILLFIASVATACNSEPAPPNPTNPEGIVTISFGASEYERSLYEPLIEAFNSQNPDIRVRFIALEVENGSNEEIVQRVVTAADTAVVERISINDMLNGNLHDLAPFIDADPSFQRDDFYPGTLEIFSRDNQTYLLPRTVPIPLLSYNKDVWAERGLPPPKSDWTWNDLMAAAEQLAQKDGDTARVYGLFDGGSPWYALLAELATVDVLPFATPLDQLQLDRPEVAQALGRVQAQVESGALYTTTPSSDGNIQFVDPHQLISDQQAAIWWPIFFNPRSSGAPEAPFAIGTVPMPLVPVPYYDLSSSTAGYVMSGGTQHPQESWRWLSFLSRQVVNIQYAVPAAAPAPARRSIAEQTKYWSHFDEETRTAIETALNRPSSLIPISKQNPIVYTILNQALQAILYEGQPVAQVLQEAQAQLVQEVASNPQTPQGSSSDGAFAVRTPQPDTVSPDVMAIKFGGWGLDASHMRRLAETFNRQTSDIAVQIVDITQASEPTQFDHIAASTDCFMAPIRPSFDSSTSILDLQPLIDADGTFTLDDYPDAFLAPFRRENRLYGLPYALLFDTLVYNRAAFDTTALAYPSINWSLDDLLGTAQQLTRNTGDNPVYGFADPSPEKTLSLFLDYFDASLVDDSGASSQLNFTDPKVVQAIEYYIELLRTASPHQQVPGYTRDSQDNSAYQLIANGQASIWFSTGLPETGAQSNVTVAVAPPPLNGTPVAFKEVPSIGLHISAHTQYPAACWSWIKYLSMDTSGLGMAFPARRSLALADDFTARAPLGSAEIYTAYAEDLMQAQPTGENTNNTPPVEELPIDYFWFYRAVDRALQGADLERELTEAQILSEAYLACVQEGTSGRTCAIQVDPDYQGRQQTVENK